MYLVALSISSRFLLVAPVRVALLRFFPFVLLLMPSFANSEDAVQTILAVE